MLTILSFAIMLIVAFTPIYSKIGKLQGEIEILRERINDICDRLNRLYNGRSR